MTIKPQILPFSGKYRCLYPGFRGHGRTRCGSLEWNSRMIADDMADSVVCKQFKQGKGVKETAELIAHPLNIVQAWYEEYQS